MTTISRGLTARRGVDAGLRLIAGVGLLVSAYIHLHRAPGYSLVGDQITEGALFRAQALAAGLAGLALLVRRHRLAWAPAVLVAAGSLVVLVGTVYVNVPAVGPFPPLYEPAWFGEKVVAVASAAAALTAAASGAALYRLTAGPAGPAASRL